jgi:5-oxoprolinase (ATP-hydrolysing)
MRFRFAIDRGGTFTDVYCEIVEGDKIRSKVVKLLSEDPSNYQDAPTEGIRRILESETGIPHPRSQRVDTSRIEYIRMGTTVATNALLERKGERCALLTTKGFADLQVIGNQSRPKIFDLEIKRPGQLYDYVREVDERVVLLKEGESVKDTTEIIGLSQERLFVEKSLNEEEVETILCDILAQGIRSLAVVLLHSYTFPHHELAIKRIADRLGFEHVSLSSAVMPMIRMVPRGCTTCVDAYLTPIIKRYLHSFSRGFDDNLPYVQVNFMQSDGGLTPMSHFCGNRAILSGPAGGVVGYAMTSNVPIAGGGDPTAMMPAIGFDMGGTSTDVSRYAGVFEHVFETTTAGVTIQSPQLDINTVAAGGGSRLFYRNGLFVVGPESVGAHPGPVCYRKGGNLAVTDANLMLGRIQAALFPAIFGPKENECLDFEATRLKFESLTVEINQYAAANSMKTYSVDEVAYGFIRVANEAMARPIRNLTTMKGFDVTAHVLACFGGAGPQHCCAIAKLLGMRKIVVHRYSGVLSAYGLSLADVVEERQEPFSGSIRNPESLITLHARLAHLQTTATAALLALGFSADRVTCTKFVNCRYHGTDTTIMVPVTDSNPASAKFVEDFIVLYKREFGFELLGRDILVDDLRVRAVGKSTSSSSSSSGSAAGRAAGRGAVSPAMIASVYFEGGRRETPVFMIAEFMKVGGGFVQGPAIVMQDVATVVIEPGCEGVVSAEGNIEITVVESVDRHVTEALDPVYLSIFSHRFMGIAEQMGKTLQRTSISVNIKERLDFSCALFDPQGSLVANAPHLPVHLGAMSEAVRYQVKHWGSDLKDGDVLVSNHPQLAGGSHLPDITVITPIFRDGKIVFFVASRGHHADVGGIAPGSMPPLSRSLVEEGAAIIAFKLVEGGVFQEAAISELLEAPGKLPGNHGTRNLSDNISDLKAQVAANHKGAALVDELCNEYTLSVVLAYMKHIQNCAEESVRVMLKQFSLACGLSEVGTVTAEDFLDDGTRIALAITISRADGSATFDFTGTGEEISGNLNAPPAVTASAIIYCLRCLLPSSDIPLNQGCLAPIRIVIPKRCILNPSPEAAVVGGNVLTSQRVTDVVLRAFQACAASQGCMNNLTFGDATMGYYETIAGGAGAGPSWHGCSGVHTHMTNTRITDPEILERRYPVLLRQFALRKGSGGAGRYRGGDGVVRELEFRRPLAVSILSERRALQPYGMSGGGSAARGRNILKKTSHRSSANSLQIEAFQSREEEQNDTWARIVSLGGKSTVDVIRGDRLVIYTPGGGGYGSVPGNVAESASNISWDTVKPPPPSTAATLVSGSLNQYVLNQES